MKPRDQFSNRYLLIGGFLLLLILPNLVMLLGLENTKNNENREFTELPEFNLSDPKRLFNDYKNYYEKNFGLKTTLVNSYIHIKSDVLKDNPLPNQVINGEDGWYFLGNAHSDILNDTFGNVPFTLAELNEITTNLVNIERDLGLKNIAFYLVVAPNKQTIYQENLPFKLKQNITRLEQLQSHLKSYTNLKIISLEKRLMSEKKNRPLYHKTDTHWTDYGAFLGYSETIGVISQDFEIKPIPLSDYHDVPTAIKGDITPMININTKENVVSLKKNKVSKIDTLSAKYTFQHYKNQFQDLKLIMHCDSFSNAWIPYFNETFMETLYVRTYVLDHALIEEIQPDIVMFEIVERHLSNLTNQK